MVGGGIASMAAAAFLIRDAGVPGENIHILETLDVPGGSLDGAESPVGAGYVTRGGRMLEDEAYRCLWNLLEGIPDRDELSKSARQGIIDFNHRVTTHAHARLIDSGHEILDAAAYGFSTRDRMELMRLLALSEHALGARRIDEMFSRHFFETNFWQMWRTTFAFQNWHSAIELRRYFIRFVQEFPRIHTLTLGSITADSSYGGRTSVPELIRDRRDGGWAFWDTIARKAPDFGRPSTFYGNIDENKLGVVHPDHARPHAAGPDYQVLRRRTGHRCPHDVGRLRLADVDRRPLPAALPGHARGHLHAVGLRVARR